MPLDARTRLVTLLGYPVEYSLSPLIHNTAFRTQTLNWAYVATPVTPEDLAAAVAGLGALHFAGANVTRPHKQAVLPHLDVLSPQAEAVGAVNTIVCRYQDGEAPALYGDNTDVTGFLEPLQPYQQQLRGAEMLVFGAGGAARAVVYALLEQCRPARLTIAARRPNQAERLAAELAAYDTTRALSAVSLDDAGAAVQASRLLVNATPLGMHPHIEGTPWAHTHDLGDGQIAYDLIYNPTETRFLREAAARGVTTIGGLEMLIGQAAAAFVQWTGQDLPLAAVRDALAPYLQNT